MSSLLFQASIITLLLLPFLISFSTANNLLDIDNNPIINGGKYYIISIDHHEEGLSYTYVREVCPLYVTLENKFRAPPKIPIKISSPLKTPFIKLNERVSLAFAAYNPCKESLVWRRNPSTPKAYITNGGDERDRSFSIVKVYEDDFPAYELKYWPSSKQVGRSNVGFYEEDGLLGLVPDEIGTLVYFEKASDNLDLSTSYELNATRDAYVN